jgi:hypothetical protein
LSIAKAPLPREAWGSGAITGTGCVSDFSTSPGGSIEALAVGRERAAAAVAEAAPAAAPRRRTPRTTAFGGPARLRDLRAALAAEEVAAPVDRLAGRALERRRRGVRQHLAADGLDRLLR